MSDIIYIDRQSGQKKIEKIYQERAVRFLYGKSKLNALFRPLARLFVTTNSLFSKCYGYFQRHTISQRKIRSFIRTFEIDESEFLESVANFRSFNDFFIRKLRPEVRPIASCDSTAVIPADGRYYFYPNISLSDGFVVKNQKFNLEELLNDSSLAKDYEEGGMVLARLCPSDYHRFHFVCDCVPSPSRLINGRFDSVNPLAIKKNIHILSRNKRMICELNETIFGRILYIEVGATNVSSIQQTYRVGERQKKGAEKGYFQFGGSTIILLFLKGSIQFDSDLLQASQNGIEVRCLMGQSMGSQISL